MSTTKLTLSVDKHLIAEAKKMAAEQHTSLSSMFSRLMSAMIGQRKKKLRLGPLTRQALGLVRLPSNKTDRELLEEALLAKYDIK